MEMTFLDGNLLETDYHQLDVFLALSEAVPASVNVDVTAIPDHEKGFLGKACHLYLVLKGSS